MMDRSEVDHFRAVLQAQLQVLLDLGSQAVHEMAGEEPDELPDPSDRATVEEERTDSLRLADLARERIGEIREALDRIDAGTFGLCTRCGRPIGAARLRVRPMTDLCIACKTELEGRARSGRPV